MQHDFLIINSTGMTREDHLRIMRGEVPTERVLNRLNTTIQKACTVAKLTLDNTTHAGKPIEQLILLSPQDPVSQETTKFYSRSHLGHSYSYRIPCGRLEQCDNPEGIFSAHYCSPSKRGKRVGAGLCRQCRFKVGPSYSGAKEELINRNKARAGEKRTRRKKSEMTG